MARRKQLAITERQFEVLTLLWEHGPMTVRDLLDRLDRDAPLPYTTVLGLLQGMERANLVTFDVENQAHRYSARLSREQATGNLLSDFVARFFRGSAERLVLGLVDADQLTSKELGEIQTKLNNAEQMAKHTKSPRKRQPRKS